MTILLSKLLTFIYHVYLSMTMSIFKKINLSLSYYLSDEFPYTCTWAETTEGLMDSLRKLAETTHLPRPKRLTPEIGQNNSGQSDPDSFFE